MRKYKEESVNLLTLIIRVVLSVLRGGPKKSPRTFI